MTTIDEKEILEIEKLKEDIRKSIHDIKNDNLETKYEAWKLALYGVAVGFGGMFALAKTILILQG
mgnify:CR=1 FL=1